MTKLTYFSKKLVNRIKPYNIKVIEVFEYDDYEIHIVCEYNDGYYKLIYDLNKRFKYTVIYRKYEFRFMYLDEAIKHIKGDIKI